MTNAKGIMRSAQTWFKGPLLYAAGFFLCVIVANIIIGLVVIGGEGRQVELLEQRELARRQAASVERALMDVETFEKHLHGEGAHTRIVNDVFRLAKKNRVKIRAGKYSPDTTERGGYSRYTISFPVEGSYRRVKKFVYDIETFKRPLVIEEISFGRSKRAGGTTELTIKLSAYLR